MPRPCSRPRFSISAGIASRKRSSICMPPAFRSGSERRLSDMGENRDTLERLYETILSRRGGDPNVSHTAKLFAKGRAKIAQKMGEEAVELAIAAVSESREAVVSESADLVFHLLVLWAECGVTIDDVRAELTKREGRSGIEEKKARQMT